MATHPKSISKSRKNSVNSGSNRPLPPDTLSSRGRSNSAPPRLPRNSEAPLERNSKRDDSTPAATQGSSAKRNSRGRSNSAPRVLQGKPHSLPPASQSADPLVTLMMNTGSFETLAGAPQLDKLKSLFKDMKEVDRTPYNLKVGSMASLGKIVIRPGSEGKPIWSISGTPKNYAKAAPRVEATLQELMSNNGQLKYIQQQEWFNGNDYEVVIDVNYYKDRPIDSRLGFHKDTGGTNLFVNLVFDNSKEIAATEWTQDRLPPQGTKMDLLKQFTPAAMRQGILDAKATLGKVAAPGRNTIQGGKLPPYAYVSWVDELVWHSTPMLDHRERIPNPREYTENLVTDVKNKFARLDELNQDDKIVEVETQRTLLVESWQKEFGYDDTSEVMRAVAATKGTRLADYLKDTFGVDPGTPFDLNRSHLESVYPFGSFDIVRSDIQKAVSQHPKIKVTAPAVLEGFTKINDASQQVERDYPDGTRLMTERDALNKALDQLRPAAQELMAAIASTPGTRLGDFMTSTFDAEVYNNLTLENLLDAYEGKHAAMLTTDLEKVAWEKVPAFGTQLGISNDLDSNVPGSKQIFGPTGIGNRPRTNSGDPASLKQLARPGETRTFLRTWVRVERPPLRKIIDQIDSMSADEVAHANVDDLIKSLLTKTDFRFVDGDVERIGSILGQRMDACENMEASDPEKVNVEQKLILTTALFKKWGASLKPSVDWRVMLPERANRDEWQNYLEENMI